MRLLEPFNGLKLASGHPLFHFAFFFGSLVAIPPKDKDILNTRHHFYLCGNSLESLIVVIRFVHIWVGTTALIRMYLKNEKWLLSGRTIKTLNLVMYQTLVLYE